MRPVKLPVPQAGPDPARQRTRAGRIIPLALIALILISCSCGCIRLVQKSLAGGDGAGAGPGGLPVSIETSTGSGQNPREVQPEVIAASVHAAQKPAASPSPPALVAEAAPVLETDVYPVQYGTRISAASETPWAARVPEFSKTYSLQGNATGLYVNVTKGPLTIGFDIDPLYDCIENPESCRGGLNSVNRPYFTITVRENGSRAIIEQDGYAREYSSQKTGRKITLYREGQYHITLEGGYVAVTLSITTGAAPYSTGPAGFTGTVGETQSQAMAEYEMRLRRTQGG